MNEEQRKQRDAKIEGVLYAAMERGAIGYSSTQRKPAVEFLQPLITEMLDEQAKEIAAAIGTRRNDLINSPDCRRDDDYFLGFDHAQDIAAGFGGDR